ncbi:MAG: response regulator [Pseudomonadota bacterium]
MSKKRALVVDDSKLARYVMKKMLSEYGMDVDTVESAEEALGYLSHKQCDIVFMDQMMPGMDGLEAVKAIKDDPVTANIPVMMYTSKGGEVFVGQARKLGAHGVVPKQVKPVELFKVLRKLQLINKNKIPMEAPTLNEPSNVAPEAVSDEDFVEPSADTMETLATVAAESVEQNSFPAQVRKLLNEQNQVLRRDFTRHTRRLVEEQWETDSKTGKAAQNSFVRQTLQMLVASIVIMLPAFLYVNLNSSSTNATPGIQNAQANKELQIEYQRVTDDNERLEKILQNELRNKRIMLDALVWAVNVKGEVPFEQSQMGDVKSQMVVDLFARLTSAGYRGQILIEGYMGDFCVTGDVNDGYKVAVDNTPMKECQTITQMPDGGKLLVDKNSYQFDEFIARPGLRGSEDISISGVFHGLEKPIYDYPELAIVGSAGEWNSTASKNNRLIFKLVPDEDWLDDMPVSISASPR